MAYAWRRFRSWLYWRQFPKAGRTVTEQHAFAVRHLPNASRGLWAEGGGR